MPTIFRSPWFSFFPDDFLGGTVDLSPAEVGAYIRLLCHQWARGSIPHAEPHKLARIAGCPVTADVLAKFPGGINRRLEIVREGAELYREKNSNNGRKGAAKRWRGHWRNDGFRFRFRKPMPRPSP